MISEYKMRNIVWIDAVSPTKEELYDLKEKFAIPENIMNELVLDELVHRVISSTPLVYLALPVPAKKNLSIHPENIVFVVGRKYIITFHKEDLPAISKFTHSISADKLIKNTDLSDHPVNVFHAIMNEAYQDAHLLTQKLTSKITKVEASLFQQKEKKTFESIYFINKDINNFKSAISRHGDLLKSFVMNYEALFPEVLPFSNTKIFSDLSNLHRKLELMHVSVSNIHNSTNSLAKHRAKRHVTRMAGLGLVVIVGGILFALGSKDSEVLRSVEEYRILITLILVAIGITFIITALVKQKRWL